MQFLLNCWMKEIFVFPLTWKLCKRIEELSEMSRHHLLVFVCTVPNTFVVQITVIASTAQKYKHNNNAVGIWQSQERIKIQRNKYLESTLFAMWSFASNSKTVRSWVFRTAASSSYLANCLSKCSLCRIDFHFRC